MGFGWDLGEWMGFGWDLENGMMLFVVLDRRVGSSGVGSVYGGNEGSTSWH